IPRDAAIAGRADYAISFRLTPRTPVGEPTQLHFAGGLTRPCGYAKPGVPSDITDGTQLAVGSPRLWYGRSILLSIQTVAPFGKRASVNPLTVCGGSRTATLLAAQPTSGALAAGSDRTGTRTDG